MNRSICDFWIKSAKEKEKDLIPNSQSHGSVQKRNITHRRRGQTSIRHDHIEGIPEQVLFFDALLCSCAISSHAAFLDRG